MKTLRQIVELKKIDLVPDPELQAGQISNYANPKSEAERRFMDKHLDTVQQALHPAFKTEAEQERTCAPEEANEDGKINEDSGAESDEDENVVENEKVD